jgi:hypothetical protein
MMHRVPEGMDESFRYWVISHTLACSATAPLRSSEGCPSSAFGRGVDGASYLGVRAHYRRTWRCVLGARDDLARGELGVVTGVVTLSDGEGQLGQASVGELDVVARIVGRGVARAQLRRERLAGRIGEAKVGGGIRRFPCTALGGHCRGLRSDAHTNS